MITFKAPASVRTFRDSACKPARYIQNYEPDPRLAFVFVRILFTALKTKRGVGRIFTKCADFLQGSEWEEDPALVSVACGPGGEGERNPTVEFFTVQSRHPKPSTTHSLTHS